MEKFIHVDRCDSTQDLLKEQLTHNPEDDFTVSCELQTKGRGRGVNAWQDGAGTLCLSINIPPHAEATFTALEISLLVTRFFEVEGSKLQLKWPNDILNKHAKKCAGILVQGAGNQYIAGIGVNLFYSGEDFGGVYDSSFTLDKKSWSKELSVFIRDNRYARTEDLIADWMMRCAHLNKHVRIIEGDHIHEGIFRGLGKHGEALLENEQGMHFHYNGSLRFA